MPLNGIEKVRRVRERKDIEGSAEMSTSYVFKVGLAEDVLLYARGEGTVILVFEGSTIYCICI